MLKTKCAPDLCILLYYNLTTCFTISNCRLLAFLFVDYRLSPVPSCGHGPTTAEEYNATQPPVQQSIPVWTLIGWREIDGKMVTNRG